MMKFWRQELGHLSTICCHSYVESLRTQETTKHTIMTSRIASDTGMARDWFQGILSCLILHLRLRTIIFSTNSNRRCTKHLLSWSMLEAFLSHTLLFLHRSKISRRTPSHNNPNSYLVIIIIITTITSLSSITRGGPSEANSKSDRCFYLVY